MKFIKTLLIPCSWLLGAAALILVSSYSSSDGNLPNPNASMTISAPAQAFPQTAAIQELTDAFGASLTGAEEVPPRTTDARGTGIAVVNASTRQMIATVTTRGITGTEAHIHQGPPGVAGPIIIPLAETTPGSGVWTAQATLTEDQYNNLKAGNLYFNVHSAAFPEGEIRGQIASQQTGAAGTTPSTDSTPQNFISSLKGQNEAPPTPSTAQGAGAMVINPDTRQFWAAIKTIGISGTDAHIHEGAPGVSGPITIPLKETSGSSGIWSANGTLTEAQYASLRQGNLYFNVHSTAFPNGEIRGQILPLLQVISTPAATPAPASTPAPEPTPAPAAPATSGY